MGVPLAGALACVAFVAGFVPYLGAIVGGAIIALAVFALGGPAVAVAVILALVAGWLIVTRLLESTAMNRRIDPHPVIVLIAIPTGLALFGVLGLFALLPVTVFGLAVSRSVVVILDLGPSGTFDTDAGAAPPPPPDLPEGVPVWLDRVAQWSWRALVLAALAGVAIAVVVRIPDRRGARRDQRRRRSHPAAGGRPAGGARVGPGSASAVVIGGSTAIILVICLAALAMTLGPLRAVIDTAAAGASSLDLIWLAHLVAEAGAALQGQLAALFIDLASFAIALVLALLMTFFFLRDGGAWWTAAMDRLSGGRRAPMAEAGRRAVTVLAGYMYGTAHHLGVRWHHQRPDDGGPWPAARAPHRRDRVLLRVHPVCRQPPGHAPGAAGGDRGRGHVGHRPDARVHGRVQHRPGQLRDAGGVRQEPVAPPGDRAHGDPRGERDRRDPGHVPRGADGGDRGGHLATRHRGDRRGGPAARTRGSRGRRRGGRAARLPTAAT